MDECSVSTILNLNVGNHTQKSSATDDAPSIPVLKMNDKMNQKVSMEIAVQQDPCRSGLMSTVQPYPEEPSHADNVQQSFPCFI